MTAIVHDIERIGQAESRGNRAFAVRSGNR